MQAHALDIRLGDLLHSTRRLDSGCEGRPYYGGKSVYAVVCISLILIAHTKSQEDTDRVRRAIV